MAAVTLKSQYSLHNRLPVNQPKYANRWCYLQEFLHATLEAQLVKHQQQIWQAFNEIDTDGSGTITVDELRKVLKDESAEVVEMYIAEYDTDKVSV